MTHHPAATPVARLPGLPAAPVAGRRLAGLGRRPGVRFAAHFAEMVVVMLVGMALFGVVTGAALGLLGIHDVHRQAPQLAVVVMAIDMTVPMVLWMRFRGHGGRMALEMAAAMVIPAVTLVAASVAGLLSIEALEAAYHPAMYGGMLAAMLFRRAEYAGSVPHRH
jgi:hypothetical protein